MYDVNFGMEGKPLNVASAPQGGASFHSRRGKRGVLPFLVPDAVVFAGTDDVAVIVAAGTAIPYVGITTDCIYNALTNNTPVL